MLFSLILPKNIVFPGKISCSSLSITNANTTCFPGKHYVSGLFSADIKLWEGCINIKNAFFPDISSNCRFQGKFSCSSLSITKANTFFLAKKDYVFILFSADVKLWGGGLHQFKKTAFSRFYQNLPYFKANSVGQALQLPTLTHL